jgi:hypothetical protein
MKMEEYILRIEDEPCNYEDGSKYYRCVDVSWYSLSDNILSKLPKLVDKLDDAYNRGYQDGAQNPTSIGYEHGYEAAMHDKGEEQDIAYFHGYSSGKHDMWNAVKYLWKNGTIDFDWSAEKILEEYEKQKEKNAIKIGDEVRLNHDDTRAVVMDESEQEDAWWVYTENGCIEEWHSSKFRKSGRTFPQIAEVLKTMREGTES